MIGGLDFRSLIPDVDFRFEYDVPCLDDFSPRESGGGDTIELELERTGGGRD